MKIRNDFVTNSSSASYIIALPHMPADKEELAGWLRPHVRDSVLTALFEKVSNAKPKRLVELPAMLSEVPPEIYNSDTETNDNFWKQPNEVIRKICRAYGKKRALKLLNDARERGVIGPTIVSIGVDDHTDGVLTDAFCTRRDLLAKLAYIAVDNH